MGDVSDGGTVESGRSWCGRLGKAIDPRPLIEGLAAPAQSGLVPLWQRMTVSGAGPRAEGGCARLPPGAALTPSGPTSSLWNARSWFLLHRSARPPEKMHTVGSIGCLPCPYPKVTFPTPLGG